MKVVLSHNKDIKKLRREYNLNKLSERNVQENPLAQFVIWFNETLKAGLIEPNAMVLATVDEKYKPSARIVLMKDFNEEGIVFFTNYESKKSKDLLKNPFASVLFFWAELERQVRIEGRVKKIKKSDSELYFKTRPYESKITALASPQSSKIPDRDFLVRKVQTLKNKYRDGNVPLPADWGGYLLIPNYFEFWQGRENRLHDRICYKKQIGKWKIFRLAP